jgi:hypothetical protein
MDFSHCELLLLEAGSSGRGEFRNPEEDEYPLEAATKQRLGKNEKNLGVLWLQ